jgi:hypothetical protein
VLLAAEAGEQTEKITAGKQIGTRRFGAKE